MSNYLALARKYRPHRFDEMVGQKEVLSALVNSLDSGKLHHAYLLSGTRGVGKTTLARIFAKALNCEKGVSSSPCCECETCRAIDEGRFVDLIEIDAASRTKVEDTRAILENVNYRPSAGRYKVYLIDEVHMLSSGSFNALLKTLEEPPEHVKFILATTDPQKIPPTVISRCIQLKLLALTEEQIEFQLKKVLDQENVSYDEDSIRLIAEAGNGSMRDSLSIADQAVALSGDNLRRENLLSMLGRMDRNLYIDLIRAVYSKKGAELYRILDSIDAFSPNYLTMLDDLISLVHQASLFSVIGGSGTCVYTYEMENLRDITASLPLDTLQLYYQILLNAKRDFIYAPSGRTAMDMVLIRMLAFTGGGSSANRGRNSAGTAVSGGGFQRTQDPGSQMRSSAGNVRDMIRGSADQPQSVNFQNQDPSAGDSRNFPRQQQPVQQSARIQPERNDLNQVSPESFNADQSGQHFQNVQQVSTHGVQTAVQSGGADSMGCSKSDIDELVSGGIQKLTLPDHIKNLSAQSDKGYSASPASSSDVSNHGSSQSQKLTSEDILRQMSEMVKEVDPAEIPWDSNFLVIGLNGERRPQPKKEGFISNITMVTEAEFKPEVPDPPGIVIPRQPAQNSIGVAEQQLPQNEMAVTEQIAAIRPSDSNGAPERKSDSGQVQGTENAVSKAPDTSVQNTVSDFQNNAGAAETAGSTLDQTEVQAEGSRDVNAASENRTSEPVADPDRIDGSGTAGNEQKNAEVQTPVNGINAGTGTNAEATGSEGTAGGTEVSAESSVNGDAGAAQSPVHEEIHVVENAETAGSEVRSEISLTATDENASGSGTYGTAEQESVVAAETSVILSAENSAESPKTETAAEVSESKPVDAAGETEIAKVGTDETVKAVTDETVKTDGDAAEAKSGETAAEPVKPKTVRKSAGAFKAKSDEPAAEVSDTNTDDNAAEPAGPKTARKSSKTVKNKAVETAAEASEVNTDGETAEADGVNSVEGTEKTAVEKPAEIRTENDDAEKTAAEREASAEVSGSENSEKTYVMSQQPAEGVAAQSDGTAAGVYGAGDPDGLSDGFSSGDSGSEESYPDNGGYDDMIPPESFDSSYAAPDDSGNFENQTASNDYPPGYPDYGMPYPEASGDLPGHNRVFSDNMLATRRKNFQITVKDEYMPDQAISYLEGKDQWLDLINGRVDDPMLRLILLNTYLAGDPDGKLVIRITSQEKSLITDAMQKLLCRMFNMDVEFEIDDNAQAQSPNGKAYVIYNKIKRQQFEKMKQSDSFRLLCKNFGCVPDINKFHLVKKK